MFQTSGVHHHRKGIKGLFKGCLTKTNPPTLCASPDFGTIHRSNKKIRANGLNVNDVDTGDTVRYRGESRPIKHRGWDFCSPTCYTRAIEDGYQLDSISTKILMKKVMTPLYLVTRDRYICISEFCIRFV